MIREVLESGDYRGRTWNSAEEKSVFLQGSGKGFPTGKAVGRQSTLRPNCRSGNYSCPPLPPPALPAGSMGRFGFSSPRWRASPARGDAIPRKDLGSLPASGVPLLPFFFGGDVPFYTQSGVGGIWIPTSQRTSLAPRAAGTPWPSIFPLG